MRDKCSATSPDLPPDVTGAGASCGFGATQQGDDNRLFAPIRAYSR